jgi:membrane protein required for colicin V production
MLNVADYALLTVLAVSMGIGLWRGFIVEVLSLTAWVAAFWLTVAFGSTVSAWFGGIESPSARFFLGHAAVFLAVLLAGSAITWLIGRAIAGSGLSTTDRLLGIGFGFARGVVLACVAVLLMGFTPAPKDTWWRESRLLPRAQTGAEWMAEFLPKAAAAELDFSPAPAEGAMPAGDALPTPPDADAEALPEAATPQASDARATDTSTPDAADDAAAPLVPET